MTLAEILAEAKRLEERSDAAYEAMQAGRVTVGTYVAEVSTLTAFRLEHFPRLARVVGAAATMRNNIAELTQFGCQPSNADIVDELERFDAAIRGEEETNGQP